jgi:hypothetical protein
MSSRGFFPHGTVRVVRSAADTGTASVITETGVIVVAGGTNINTSVSGSAINVNLDTAVTGLTDIDMTAADHTILDSVAGHTVTMGATATTFSIPGNLTVSGTLTATGTSTKGNETITNLTVTGFADIEGYAAIGNGSAVNANYGLLIDYDRTYTADGSAQLKVAGTVTGRDSTSSTADNTFFAATIEPESMTVPASTDLVASLHVADPTITITGVGTTLDVAATLYLGSAPTEASANYSLYSTSGTAQFDACDSFNIFSSTNAKPVLHLKTTAAGADGPEIILESDNGASEVDDDFLGVITFKGDDSTNASTTFANVQVKASDVTNSAECGTIDMNVMANGTLRNLVSIGGQDVAGGDPLEVVINDESVDCDFRVESNGQANMLLVDGGNDRVGIQCSPAYGLDVAVVGRFQNYIAMKEISAPTHVAGHALLYAMDDAGTSEMHVEDSAGNVTKISPHNGDDEWEFLSRNKRTGKVVRIQMQKLMRRLNEQFGEPEWFEEYTDDIG